MASTVDDVVNLIRGISSTRYEISPVTLEVELHTLPWHPDETNHTVRRHFDGLHSWVRVGETSVVIATVTATGERFAVRRQFYEAEPVGMGRRCPVCRGTHLKRWGEYDSVENGEDCPCGMYSSSFWAGRVEERFGWWYGVRFLGDGSYPTQPGVVDEARRLLDDMEAVHFQSCVKTDTDWLVFADWLDEHEYTLTAASIREGRS